MIPQWTHFFLTRFRGGRALAFNFSRAARFRVDMCRPGNIIDEWERTDEITVLTVYDIEEAISVCMGSRFNGFTIFIVLKQPQLVITREVPGIIRRVLVEPVDFPRRRINGDLTGGVEVIVVLRIASLGGSFPGIPGDRVSRADDDLVVFNVKTGTLPRGTTTVASGFNLAGITAWANVVRQAGSVIPQLFASLSVDSENARI